MKNKKGNHIYLNFCLSVVTIYNMFSVLPNFFLGISSQFWNETNAVVVEKTLHEVTGRKKGLYSPRIDYQYTVDGDNYTNDVLSFAYFVFGKKWASDQIIGYEPGQEIKIYYNPSNPARSCIQPGTDKWTVAYTSLGVLILFFVIISIVRRGIKL